MHAHTKENKKQLQYKGTPCSRVVEIRKEMSFIHVAALLPNIPNSLPDTNNSLHTKQYRPNHCEMKKKK